MCLLISSTTFVWSISYSKKKWARYDQKCKLVLKLSTRHSLSDFNETWNFSTVFRKMLKYKISCKSAQWAQSCFMRTDGRTDMTKLIVAFRNFANTPKNVYSLNVCHPRCVSTTCNNKTIHHYPTLDCINSEYLHVSAVRDSRNM